MSARQLGEHYSYLRDLRKLKAYERALTNQLRGSYKVVLDLGTGTGLLGVLAARAGAARVYAVDSGRIIGPAAEVARRSGLTDRIIHVRCRSDELDLPEAVDLAVCDQIGGFVYDAGVLEYFSDVRRRLLAPDGVLLPAGFRMFLAPAECSTVREQIDLWGSRPAGFDFGVFRELAINTEHRVNDDEVEILAAPVEVARIPSDHIESIKGEGETDVVVGGRCDGLVGFFEADMGGGVTLTNRPGDPERMHRWCNFYPISSAVPVTAGQHVHVDIDVRPLLPAVTWRVTIRSSDGEVLTNERHSTLLGEFVGADDLRRGAGSVIRATPVGDAVAHALRLADGSRSTDQVIREVRTIVSGFPRSPAVEQTVRDVIERFSVPVR